MLKPVLMERPSVCKLMHPVFLCFRWVGATTGLCESPLRRCSKLRRVWTLVSMDLLWLLEPAYGGRWVTVKYLLFAPLFCFNQECIWQSASPLKVKYVPHGAVCFLPSSVWRGASWGECQGAVPWTEAVGTVLWWHGSLMPLAPENHAALSWRLREQVWVCRTGLRWGRNVFLWLFPLNFWGAWEPLELFPPKCSPFLLL